MIEKLPFGQTGHMSTRILFGAAALGPVTQEEADRTLETLLKHGINHIDTAASYGDSELRIGPWMAEHRKNFFLATKTGDRTYKGAKEELHRSLERLRVDSVDLWQMHVLVEPEDWETAMGPGGALEAFIEAKEQGLVRFLGVTGHGLNAPAMHLRSLERYDFDSVLAPCNYILLQNPAYKKDYDRLYQVCHEKKIALQIIKTTCRRPWGERQQTAATWYEPMTEQKDIDTAIHWALDRKGVFVNSVGDIHVLPKVLEAAERYNPGDREEEMAAVAKTIAMESLFT